MSLGKFYSLSKSTLDLNSSDWFYLSDELFLSANPSLYRDIGSNVCMPTMSSIREASLLFGNISVFYTGVYR